MLSSMVTKTVLEWTLFSQTFRTITQRAKKKLQRDRANKIGEVVHEKAYHRRSDRRNNGDVLPVESADISSLCAGFGSLLTVGDTAGTVVLRWQLRRSEVLEFFQKLPGCLVGIKACASAHYWARELTKFSHDVRLMQPSYVKGYVKRGKTAAADAEAICEAVSRVHAICSGEIGENPGPAREP